jgi:outer membrane protein assembly factor BamE (lipoprotein component of BamABCDE complex)
MRKSALLLSVLLLVSALGQSGCATNYGPKIDRESASRIVKGSTTRAEIVGWFGDPTMTNFEADGAEQSMWTSMQSKVSGSTFIPFVGGFVGKNQTTTGTLTVIFDKNGVVKDYRLGTSGTTSGFGSFGTTKPQ